MCKALLLRQTILEKTIVSRSNNINKQTPDIPPEVRYLASLLQERRNSCRISAPYGQNETRQKSEIVTTTPLIFTISVVITAE